METTSIRLPAELVRALDTAATRQGVNRSAIVRRALREHLGRRARERSTLADRVDELVTYRGSGAGDLATRSEEHLRERLSGRRHRSR